MAHDRRYLNGFDSIGLMCVPPKRPNEVQIALHNIPHVISRLSLASLRATEYLHAVFPDDFWMLRYFFRSFFSGCVECERPSVKCGSAEIICCSHNFGL